MIRGLYSAATALDAAMQRHEVISHNIAHITTPGYRERGVVFQTFDRVLGRDEPPTGDINGTTIAETYANFRPGALQQTNNPYELALDNDGFFVFNGPNGPIYSRNGSIRIGLGGQLVTVSGYPVSGTNGTLTVPAGTVNLSVSRDGNVTADGNAIGQLQVVRFNNLKELTAVGPSLFRAGNNAGLEPVNNGVLQGYRESSNVNPAQGMAEMIQESRYFDASQRVLRAIAESLALNTRPQ